MSISTALQADRAGRFVEAAKLYGELVGLGSPPLVVLLNLALLYWESTDPGIAAAEHLSPEFMAVAERRRDELLDQAAKQFPESTDVLFWRKYIAWADLGEPFEPQEAKDLLRRAPTVLVPAMHVFVATDGRECVAEAHALLRMCREDGTTGARLIVAQLEAVLRRARFGGSQEPAGAPDSSLSLLLTHPAGGIARKSALRLGSSAPDALRGRAVLVLGCAE